MKKKHLVIVGGGFGGMALAQALRSAEVNITLIDRQNHHLFQPLLYQVAVGALAPGDIATPLRLTFHRQANVELVMDEVTRIDRAARLVHLAGGEALAYDQLVVAVGNRPSYFGHPEWAQHAPGLKDITDALEIRAKLFTAFERASRIAHPAQRAALLTFVLVGGGPTGVELAGSIAEIGSKTMRNEFRNLGPNEINVILLEGGPRLLASYQPKLSIRAQRDLERMGVSVRLNTFVKNITPEGVQAGDTFIPTQNVIWAAGNQAMALLQSLDTPLDKSGAVLVDADCSLPTDPDVFVIGDAASYVSGAQKLPNVAQVAMQMGSYLARIVRHNIPKSERKPFQYVNKGDMATIGRSRAIGELGSGRHAVAGFWAWLLWCAIHVFMLINFRSRMRVMVEWFWYYITFQPGSRILYRTSHSSSPVTKT